jgi:hypothetical protein
LLKKSTLAHILARILWLPIQHNAVNYPIAYYGAFVPNMPTKLYDDPRGKADEYSIYSLPDSRVATVSKDRCPSYYVISFAVRKSFIYEKSVKETRFVPKMVQ